MSIVSVGFKLYSFIFNKNIKIQKILVENRFKQKFKY